MRVPELYFYLVLCAVYFTSPVHFFLKASVQYIGKWSCYFWDFKMKTLTIMDPCFMKSDPLKVSLHHQQAAMDLHKALIDCKTISLLVGLLIMMDGISCFQPTMGQDANR